MLQVPSEERTRATPDSVSLREIAVRLSGLVHASLVGRLRAREIVAELRAVADWIEGGTKPASPAKEEVTTQVELEIFQYWVARFNKTRARFTPERRAAVRARLRDGYTAEDIRRAIDGCKASPFHNGENKENTTYDDLLLICRNGTKIERFRELAKEQGTQPLAVNGSEEMDARVLRLSEDAQEALKKGDTNAYNRAQDEIKKLRGSIRNAGAVGEDRGRGRAAANS